MELTRIEFPVGLTDNMYQTAEYFAKISAQNCKRNLEKINQIRLNTLAVLVTKYYCDFLDIESDLNTDSWNTAMQLFFDQADLNLKGVGKLECRPVLPGKNQCYIPEEVRNDRIGYMVIKIDEKESEGWILGFVPKVESEYLSLDNLQSLYDFIDYIDEIKYPSVSTQVWLKVQAALQTGWRQNKEYVTEEVTEHLKSLNILPKPALGAFRFKDTNPVQYITMSDLETIGRDNQDIVTNALSEILDTSDDSQTRWQAAISLAKIDPNNQKAGFIHTEKLIDLGIEPKLTLIIALIPQKDQKVGVFIHLVSASENSCLPPGLKLAILSASNKLGKEVEARSNEEGKGKDNSIAIPTFNQPLGTNFRVRITLNEICLADEDIAV